MTTIRLFVRARLGATLIATLFAASAFASGQTEFLVYSFPLATRSSMAAGCTPKGNLVADSAGNLYGTTKNCGAGVGVVFELTRPVPPNTEWTETVLYTFATSTLDGSNPQEGVVFDALGNLYGTTASGGATGFGVVFELSPPATAGGPWTESILYNFQGGVTDGAGPSGGVVFDSADNLYGVTANGGSGEQEYDFDSTGVAYKLTPPVTPGAPWTETVLHHFLARAGVVHPVGALVFDGKGNLYGASEGGTSIGHSLGAAAYKLAPASGSGEWTQTLLYSFGGPSDGPQSGLTFHNSGRLYGTTTYGGQFVAGSVFELVPPVAPSDAWTENVLYSFNGVANDGVYPVANVIFDKAGNLYGTTQYGGGKGNCGDGIPGCGTVFELATPAPEGGNWTETILHSFDPGPRGSVADGAEPTSGLLLWKNSELLGVTPDGGKGSEGTVFAVIP
jgi:uncharacterized repeat protein (TIGR03803 family)